MNEKLPVSKGVLLPEDDAPELTEEWFNEADVYRAGKLVKRGRPAQAVTKVAVKLRLDPHIIATFKAGGPGWQTRINQALDEWLSNEAGRNDADMPPHLPLAHGKIGG
jgi:uncharacterized protein (DUF4415 family)